MDLKFRAFLSYAHHDERWASWIHRKLENFVSEPELIGRETPIGAVPRNLRPIFRDRDEFAGGDELDGATIKALDQSRALIVVCSEVSAERPAVNKEVRLFRHRHPRRPVIPVIISGTYPDNFPPALLFQLDENGNITDRPITFLGADLRETADGKLRGIAKTIAALLGVEPDEIVRRAERAARARLRNWLVGLSTVAVTLVALTVWAEINRRDANEKRVQIGNTLDQLTEQSNRMVFRLVDEVEDGIEDNLLIERVLQSTRQSLQQLTAQDIHNERARLTLTLIEIRLARHWNNAEKHTAALQMALSAMGHASKASLQSNPAFTRKWRLASVGAPEQVALAYHGLHQTSDAKQFYDLTLVAAKKYADAENASGKKFAEERVAKAHINLANLLWPIANGQSEKLLTARQHFDQARRICDRLKSHSASAGEMNSCPLAQALKGIGITYFRDSSYKEAIAVFNLAIAEWQRRLESSAEIPVSLLVSVSDTHRLTAVCHSRTGQDAKALSSIEQSAKVLPASNASLSGARFKALSRLSWYATLAGSNTTALSSSETALAMLKSELSARKLKAPKFHKAILQAKLNRAHALYVSGRLESAVDLYGSLIKADPAMRASIDADINDIARRFKPPNLTVLIRRLAAL